MKQRTITAIILIITLIPLLIIGQWYFVGLCCLITYLAGFELLKAISSEKPFFKYLKYIIPLFNSLTLLLFHHNVNNFYLIVVLNICLMMGFMLFNKINSKDVAFMIMTYLYSGVMFTYVTALRFVGDNSDKYFNHGFYLFLWVIIIMSTTDSGAYFIGSKWGKRKLCPAISPKKTIEGSIGGLIIGLICGIAYYIIVSLTTNYYLIGDLIEPTKITHYIVVVIIILFLSCIGQIGDLIASKIKRDFDIKDYSQIFPGHGGILDRFDSLLYAGCFLYLILMILL